MAATPNNMDWVGKKLKIFIYQMIYDHFSFYYICIILTLIDKLS